MVVRLHLPAVCKVKTTVNSIHFMLKPLHLPAVCKVKTTDWFAIFAVFTLHLPAVCKVKTTYQHLNLPKICCICLLFER